MLHLILMTPIFRKHRRSGFLCSLLILFFIMISSCDSDRYFVTIRKLKTQIENIPRRKDGNTHTMLIPTRDQCLDLMARERMPHHIQRHSKVVTRVALYLSRQLNRNGVRLNLDLVESAGLLHDIAKARCIETGENHASVGAQMLQKWGYPLLAPIVEEHISFDPASLKEPLTESLIVNYADKRVKHDEIVTVEDRFHDLIERYAKTQEVREILLEKLNQYLLLEQKIFEHISVEPADLVHLPLDD